MTLLDRALDPTTRTDPGGADVAAITFIDPDGTSHPLTASVGTSVKDVAVQNGVPGIIAECGGFLSCASCHVYVDEAWVDRTGRATDNPDPTEDEILDGAMAERLDGSRLSCQVKMTDELDGLVVRVAPEQM